MENLLFRENCMTVLDALLATAFANKGQQEDVNKFYLTLLTTPLYLPVKKSTLTAPSSDSTQAIEPLCAVFDEKIFLVIFDTLERLETWAGNHWHDMHYVVLPGREIIANISDEVYLSLNIGSPYYKEFTPEEVQRLKIITTRLDQLKN